MGFFFTLAFTFVRLITVAQGPPYASGTPESDATLENQSTENAQALASSLTLGLRAVNGDFLIQRLEAQPLSESSQTGKAQHADNDPSD